MTTWVKRLLIANLVVFVLSGAFPVIAYLGMLVPFQVLQRPWSPVTYMFLHAGIWHLLFNMIGLFFFGPRLEQRIGSRDFLYLYFVSGLVAALFSFLFAPNAAVVGASGAVFGVLLGFASFWPDEPIYIWGVLPVPAKVLVAGLAVLSIYSAVAGGQSTVAHMAHLGGFVGGWIFLRWRIKRPRKSSSEDKVSRLHRIAEEVRRNTTRWDEIRLDELHEINRTEVDRLRAKIRERGAGSLTVEEREFLDRMSSS